MLGMCARVCCCMSSLCEARHVDETVPPRAVTSVFFSDSFCFCMFWEDVANDSECLPCCLLLPSSYHLMSTCLMVEQGDDMHLINHAIFED